MVTTQPGYTLKPYHTGHTIYLSFCRIHCFFAYLVERSRICFNCSQINVLVLFYRAVQYILPGRVSEIIQERHDDILLTFTLLGQRVVRSCTITNGQLKTGFQLVSIKDEHAYYREIRLPLERKLCQYQCFLRREGQRNIRFLNSLFRME